MLRELGFECTTVGKTEDEPGNAIKKIESGEVDLVINIPRTYDELGRPDGYLIRRRAVDANVPLLTDLQLARAVIEALKVTQESDLELKAWAEYQKSTAPVLA